MSAPKCVECGRPHTDPEKFDGDWCWDCFDGEMVRSSKDDALGYGVRGRPPKCFLKAEEYKQYGY